MDASSQWLVENEESLYNELMAKTCSDTSESNSWWLKGYGAIDSGTLLGQLTQKLTQGDTAIGVYFTFSKGPEPRASIHLTSFFNRHYATVVDTLLNDTGPLNLFTIQKSGQGTEAGTIDFGKGKKVNLRNIRAEIKGSASPFDMHFYIKGYKPELIAEIHEDLFKSILGETLYVKKVNSITYELASTLNASLLLIRELRKELNK